MKTIIKISLFAVAALHFGACGGYEKAATNNTNTVNANANTAAKPAPPTKEALAALETKAFEAWKNKDGKFFEGFLADNFVSFNSKGERADRATEIKMITDAKCEVKSFSFSDERVTPVGADAAVFTVKATTDYTCDGKPGPSPVVSATVYVRSGDAWKAAYHNEVPIIDPKDMKADATKAAPSAKPAAPADAKPADALTETLMAAEKKGWEAWKARDAKTLDEITGKDLVFVDIFGKVTGSKADVIKGWTESKCEIKSVGVTDGKGVSLTKDAAILTFKGTADGTCDGSPLFPLWGTTLLVKEGETWKAVYIFETPA